VEAAAITVRSDRYNLKIWAVGGSADGVEWPEFDLVVRNNFVGKRALGALFPTK